MKAQHFNILNFVMFQALWVAGVIYQNAGLWVCIALVSIHFVISPQRAIDIKTALLALAIGFSVDFSLMQSGVFIFSENQFPLWLLCLWIGFVLTLRYSMAWLKQQSWVIQALLGGIGGTCSYVAGWRFGAVEFGFDIVTTCLVLGAIWATLVPLFFVLMEKVNPNEAFS